MAWYGKNQEEQYQADKERKKDLLEVAKTVHDGMKQKSDELWELVELMVKHGKFDMFSKDADHQRMTDLYWKYKEDN